MQTPPASVQDGRQTGSLKHISSLQSKLGKQILHQYFSVAAQPPPPQPPSVHWGSQQLPKQPQSYLPISEQLETYSGEQSEQSDQSQQQYQSKDGPAVVVVVLIVVVVVSPTHDPPEQYSPASHKLSQLLSSTHKGSPVQEQPSHVSEYQYVHS